MAWVPDPVNIHVMDLGDGTYVLQADPYTQPAGVKQPPRLTADQAVQQIKRRTCGVRYLYVDKEGYAIKPEDSPVEQILRAQELTAVGAGQCEVCGGAGKLPDGSPCPNR